MNALLILATAASVLLRADRPPVYPDLRQPLPQAYFVFQATYLDDSRWPAHYHPFTVFVCNGSIGTTGLSRMRWVYPDAKRLGYMDAQGIKVDGEGLPGGSAYYDSLRVYFDSTYCVRVLETNECLRQGQTSPAWIPCQASVDAVAAFHQQMTMNADWNGGLFDGMYIDDCTASYPSFRLAYIADSIAAGRHIDINGDGVADTAADATAQWALWRPYLTEKMRAVVGDKILIANTAGRVDDPCLNGICIEGIGHTATQDSATVWFEAQKAMSVAPFIGIGWVKATTDSVPTQNAVNATEGVYYGLIE